MNKLSGVSFYRVPSRRSPLYRTHVEEDIINLDRNGLNEDRILMKLSLRVVPRVRVLSAGLCHLISCIIIFEQVEGNYKSYLQQLNKTIYSLNEELVNFVKQQECICVARWMDRVMMSLSFSLKYACIMLSGSTYCRMYLYRFLESCHWVIYNLWAWIMRQTERRATGKYDFWYILAQ